MSSTRPSNKRRRNSSGLFRLMAPADTPGRRLAVAPNGLSDAALRNPAATGLSAGQLPSQRSERQGRYTSPLFRGHWSRFSIVVGRDERKDSFRHLVSGDFGPASPPGVYTDRHRRSADSQYLAIETDFIPHKNRFMKNHSVHGNGRATAAASPTGGISRGKIHLRHQPAAENVSGGIGIGWHGNRTDQRFTFRLVSRIGHKNFGL
jgi:hypothetical protein